ncbi:hypothetical protein ACTI_71230 [Actinoplanes sp. OR16]|uniref:2'-5' RNA ligase family protein n=1 Tax=Actinoplanes sp. OR16 TaxID=946334 RepID=UPI000F6F3D13|nr:2'-5' RNA ligase family protein [Actinoplanes sp. OR16]BBH70438.1 hypothetical protein ACTI_71230 [Actinoplanes sp. OR16]
MKPFELRHGTGEWPAGETLLHVYAVPDLAENPELAKLTQGCREALAPYPLTPVGDPWLHITLMQITDQFGGRYSAADRAELAAALRADLAGFGGFELTIGSCLARHSGVTFDVHPDDDIVRLGAAVNESVGRVRGPAALKYHAGIPHMAVAYAHGEADNADVQRDLSRVRPSHAPMTVTAVQLVDVAGDPEAKTITWSLVDTIPL